MKTQKCRTFNEFKAWMDGFRAGRNGRPPSATEWAEILNELDGVQVELVSAIMADLDIPSSCYTPPIISGTINPHVPKTIGKHR